MQVQLSFLCAALIVYEIYPPMKFQVYTTIWKITKGNNSKNMQGGVIILVHCTPPHYDLSTYEVSSWYLKYFLRYAPDKNDGRKDGRTYRRVQLYMPPTSLSHKKSIYKLDLQKSMSNKVKTLFQYVPLINCPYQQSNLDDIICMLLNQKYKLQIDVTYRLDSNVFSVMFNMFYSDQLNVT
jgi:hypothetical protein